MSLAGSYVRIAKARWWLGAAVAWIAAAVGFTVPLRAQQAPPDAPAGSERLLPNPAPDQQTPDPQSLDQQQLHHLPVREITVFKDGHVFVQHEGTLPVDAHGRVRIDHVPAPVIGTFWPYSAEADAPLRSVTAGKHTVRVRQTALSLRELLEANVGARVYVVESGPEPRPRYAAEVVALPQRTPEELQRVFPGTAAEAAQSGEVALLKTSEGFKAVPLEQIHQVTFLEQPHDQVEIEQQRHVLTLQLQWPDSQQGGEARVGMVYLQRGIRWIPQYRVDLDGGGNATLRLQATLLNELTDLHDVTVHLVIGVPKFQLADTLDPIGLGRVVAQLSQHFQQDAQTAFGFSNAIMTQVAMPRAAPPRPAEPTGSDLGPDIALGTKEEDLFVFTLRGVSLRRGERAVLPVAEFSLPYRDVFVVHVPMVPPQEVRQHFNSSQQAELARLHAAPKAEHVLRLTNNAPFPLTTAPATVFLKGRIQAQGMMTYTPTGAACDLRATTAVDIGVHHEEAETARHRDAERWGSHTYDRIELKGTISLVNYRRDAVELEVVRDVLGNVTRVGADGNLRKLDPRDHSWSLFGGYPSWWHWYGWPGWWLHFNGAARVTWQVKLEPQQRIELNYDWHYYWRN